MNRENIEQEIKEEWFKDHIAEFTKDGDIAVLRWGVPGSNFYRVRYVFDYNKIYITGDIGDSIFKIYDEITLEKVINLDVHYFHKKLTAMDDDKYSFDDNTAIARIKEEIECIEEDKDIDEDGVEEDTDRNKSINEHIKLFRELINESEECYNIDSWKYVVDQRYDELSDYDCDIHEWIYKAGNVIPNRVYAYLIGLEMAYEQLKKQGI